MELKEIKNIKGLTVMDSYGLIVAGGGLTGVAAAVAAARRGIRVLLLERANCLGGAAANNLVFPFMPYRTSVDGKIVDLSAGFFKELTGSLEKAGAIGESICDFDTEYLKLVLNRKVLKENISLLFGAFVKDCIKEGDRITAVQVQTKSGEMTFYADIFIDATGDADLSAIAGIPFELGREEDGLCQPMTLCFRVGNVDAALYNAEEQNRINRAYREYKAAGKIKNPRNDVLIFKTPVSGILHFNTTRVIKRNPLDAWDITAAEIEAREQVFELMDFLKAVSSAFKNSVLLETAPQIGVRESRRIVGKHILTAEELKDCTVFEDSIAAGNYDIDIHDPSGGGTKHYFFPAGKYYTIPYRSLLPASGAENLLTAGRCISATHEAQASIRIMPICCCLGEAAGEAAALALETGVTPEEISLAELQSRLRANGAKIF